jgi:hypothetical protein
MFFLFPLSILATQEDPLVRTHYGDAYGTPAKFDYRQTFKYPLITTRPHIPYFNQSGGIHSFIQMS